jgi:hypothetical protein
MKFARLKYVMYRNKQNMELHILYTELRKADFIEMGWGRGVVAKISLLVFEKVVLKAIFINALRYVIVEKLSKKQNEKIL